MQNFFTRQLIIRLASKTSFVYFLSSGERTGKSPNHVSLLMRGCKAETLSGQPDSKFKNCDLLN